MEVAPPVVPSGHLLRAGVAFVSVLLFLVGVAGLSQRFGLHGASIAAMADMWEVDPDVKVELEEAINETLKDAPLPEDEKARFAKDVLCAQIAELCRAHCLEVFDECIEFWKPPGYDWNNWDSDNRQCMDENEDCGDACDAAQDECQK